MDQDPRFDMTLLAYCGLYCEQCSVRTACAEQDARHMEHFPAQLVRGRELGLSDPPCEGCKGRNLCGPCKIKGCASAKGIGHCGECGEFPCETLSAFGNDGIPHHRRALANLRRIREVGVDVWFGELKPSLRCHCGERLSWYRVCPDHS